MTLTCSIDRCSCAYTAEGWLENWIKSFSIFSWNVVSLFSLCCGCLLRRQGYGDRGFGREYGIAMIILTFLATSYLSTTLLWTGRDQLLSPASFAATPLTLCCQVTDLLIFPGKHPTQWQLWSHTLFSLLPHKLLLIPANPAPKSHLYKVSPSFPEQSLLHLPLVAQSSYPYSIVIIYLYASSPVGSGALKKEYESQSSLYS